ncbi:MAG: TetR family transcriptional regulator [Proteobacteria bacterium]|nr:TetR family transcriptional regulator [Pseudomonadota bacterium]MBW3616241.1 TetR family transcriptional regulator [Pseudomonadota bacterium]
MTESEALDRAVDAALALAADRPWREITLADIAGETGLSFAELYARTPSKNALLSRLARRFDTAAAEAVLEGETHDRLFEAAMARLEAMEPHRFVLLAIARDEQAERIAARLPRTARVLLQAAGVPTEGLAGAARVAAMTAVWARVLQVWRDDEGALNRTMAEIDSRLKQMRDRLGRIGAGF